MATLRDIVEAILSDLTSAQNNANKLTRALASEYQDDAMLQYLSVPNALMEEVEFSLSFAALDDPVTASAAPIHASAGETASNHRLRALAQKVADIVLDDLAEGIRSTTPPATPPDQSPAEHRLADSLTTTHTRHGVANHLLPLLKEAFRLGLDGEFPMEKLLGNVQEKLHEIFSAEKALRAVLGNVSERVAEVLHKNREQITGAVESARHSVSTGNDGELEKLLSTNVIVDGTNLADLPEQAIQKLHLRVRLKNYRWVLIDGGEQQLLPENN